MQVLRRLAADTLVKLGQTIGVPQVLQQDAPLRLLLPPSGVQMLQVLHEMGTMGVVRAPGSLQKLRLRFVFTQHLHHRRAFG